MQPWAGVLPVFKRKGTFWREDSPGSPAACGVTSYRDGQGLQEGSLRGSKCVEEDHREQEADGKGKMRRSWRK